MAYVSDHRKPRTCRRRALVLVASIFVIAAAASGRQKAKAPDDLPGRVAQLGQQLWGVPLDESEPLTGPIEKLVLGHLDQWLAAHPGGGTDAPGEMPYAVKVRREIESLFAGLHSPVYATGNTFERPFADGQLLAAGYTLSWSDFDRVNVLALYQVHGSTVRQVALTRFFPGVDVHFHFFPAPASAAGQFWFMMYGTRLGKSSPRLSAELYAFDGQALKSLWQVRDVYDGRFSFPPTGGRVVMSYLREDELTQAIASSGHVTRHEAAYHVSATGFDLEYDH